MDQGAGHGPSHQAQHCDLGHRGDGVNHSPGMDHIANEALSIIEIAEARQLNWGFINGTQTDDDIVRLLAESPADAAEDTATLSAQAIIENLV